MRSQISHTIEIVGDQLSLDRQTWKCSCGKWEMAVPAVGAFGHRSAKARIAQVDMGFGKHVKFAGVSQNQKNSHSDQPSRITK
jgi:hypothetical protein